LGMLLEKLSTFYSPIRSKYFKAAFAAIFLIYIYPKRE
jgi:hypothetical protein